MTRALRQLFFPWQSQFSPTYTAVCHWKHPCGHREARVRLTEELENGEVKEGVKEKNEGAAQQCITNNHRSATAALSTPALTVVA